MNSMKLWWAVLLAVASLWGCAAPTGGGTGSAEGGGKADCASQDACDSANARSALAQLGLGRFLRPGDHWTVAWVYRNDDSTHRDLEQQIGNATFQEPVLVDYAVVETGEETFGRVTRATATVAVTAKTTAPAAFQTLVGEPFASIDERVDYTINELFNPVAKTFYALDDLGRTVSTTVALDGRSNLTMQFDSLPNGYPNIDRIEPRESCDADFWAHLNAPDRRDYTACWDAAPELPESLRDLAAATGLDFAAPGIHFAPTDAQPDYMFWQPGRLHPTFVSGPRGMGIIVSEND